MTLPQGIIQSEIFIFYTHTKKINKQKTCKKREKKTMRKWKLNKR